jgi:hypothetical protein
MGLLDKVQTCDPAPNPHHTVELVKGDGQVSITIRVGWDGVSVWPNCVGPIIDLRLRNVGTDTWILNMPNGRKLKNRSITPGTDVTLTGAQLENLGVTTIADLEGFTLIRESTTTTRTQARPA